MALVQHSARTPEDPWYLTWDPSSGTRTALATRRVELRRLRTDTKESVALSTHVESEVGRESGEAVGEVGRDSRTCLGHGCTWL